MKEPCSELTGDHLWNDLTVTTALAAFVLTAFGSPFQEAVAPVLPPPPILVELDGRIVNFPNAKPKAYVGRILVPLRSVFEDLGAFVEYDSTMQKITARFSDEEIELRIGDRVAKRNGAEILLDVAPLIDQGSAMVPLRFLAESLGAKVRFFKSQNKVVITSVTPRPEEPF